ncbi:hypothetical protein U91I_01019 [alpha proteobacterium U9-1i]|nr:hypothetical protein U91I_01019 [alpha proteobacterium U9-1i]
MYTTNSALLTEAMTKAQMAPMPHASANRRVPVLAMWRC